MMLVASSLAILAGVFFGAADYLVGLIILTVAAYIAIYDGAERKRR